MTNSTDHIEVIDSSHGSVSFSQIWYYRDLLWLMVRRDFVAFYKQTVFGPLWFFIQPLFTTFIFTLLFNKLAGITTEGVPPVLFYMAGITLWNYFSDCLLKTSTVFKDNAQIFGKVYFPRLIIPLSIVCSNLIRFFVQLMLLALFIIGYYIKYGVGFNLSVYLLLFPVIVILMALFGLGLGMIISAMTAKYRDLSFLVSFGVQLMMYATTVAYPLSATPTEFKFWVLYNPMTTLIETFRFALFGSGSFSWAMLILHTIVVLLVFLSGAWIFSRVEKNFMDTV